MREYDESGGDVKLWILKENKEGSEIIMSLKSGLKLLVFQQSTHDPTQHRLLQLLRQVSLEEGGEAVD